MATTKAIGDTTVFLGTTGLPVPAPITAVMRRLGCHQVDHDERPYCGEPHHPRDPWFHDRWGLQGCLFAGELAELATTAHQGDTTHR